MSKIDVACFHLAAFNDRLFSAEGIFLFIVFIVLL